MQILTGAVGALLVLGICGIPTKEQVSSAIERAQQINLLKRGIESLYARELVNSAPVKKCPLADFHGKRSNSNADKDRAVNDMITAAQLLQNEGFSTADLRAETVISEMERNLVLCDPLFTGTCDTAVMYRTPDGSCNNLANPSWGMTGVAQRREIAADYDDGLSNPRQTDDLGNSLPNPRTISNAVHRGERGQEVLSESLTLHAFQMGQFLDHDIIATPLTSAVADCCASTDLNNCFAIKLQGNDQFNRNFRNNYCMNVPRSSPQFCPSGSGTREQTNAITSYIDASNVYGSTLEEQTKLRNGGFMRVADGDRLPDAIDGSCSKGEGQECSLAGDHRVNVVPSLTSYHTTFVREHNRIAALLQPSYPDDDETLFQETRRIIIGIMQKIVYDEFLPSFLSQAAINKYNLGSTATFAYSADLEATVDNGFGIAYRFGHTWIPRNMDIYDVNLRPVIRRRTEDTYDDVALTYKTGYPTGLNGLSYWLSGENSPDTDSVVEDAARNNLFLDENNDSFDLVALNIQRGRDHGIPSYSKFREACGLSDVTSWTDLKDHNAATIARLQEAYGTISAAEIDLFTGALTETAVTGGKVGPILECILGDQFNRLKFGDRFWYQGTDAKFTAAQQDAINGYSMSKVLCNCMEFQRIHAPNAFLSTPFHIRTKRDAAYPVQEMTSVHDPPIDGVPMQEENVCRCRENRHISCIIPRDHFFDTQARKRRSKQQKKFTFSEVNDPSRGDLPIRAQYGYKMNEARVFPSKRMGIHFNDGI